MTPEQFAYWLQGFAELSGVAIPTVEQWQSIREHLATVFEKVTPPVRVDGNGSAFAGPARNQLNTYPGTVFPQQLGAPGPLNLTC